MIRENIFFPPSMLWEIFAQRDDLIMFYQVVTQVHERLMYLLLGLNKLYFRGSLKWTDSIINTMKILPENFLVDYKGHYRLEPIPAARSLLRTVLSVLDLVDRHVPNVSTQEARERLDDKRV